MARDTATGRHRPRRDIMVGPVQGMALAGLGGVRPGIRRRKMAGLEIPLRAVRRLLHLRRPQPRQDLGHPAQAPALVA
jgi:hypothetical protein